MRGSVMFALLLAALAIGQAARATDQAKVHDLGSRLELFVDNWLIDTLQGAALRLHAPVPREVAVRFDAPWEGRGSTYVTVFKDGDRYRMYYRGNNGDERSRQVTCYAESPDGIRWTKPKLGLHDFAGSKDNNIVYPSAHNFAPFKDANPEAPPGERYKAIAGMGNIYLFVSSDGLQWKPSRTQLRLANVAKGGFDSQNIVFWDEQRRCYVGFFRGWNNRRRDIITSTSKDFATWTDSVYLDYGAAPAEELYTNAITPYFRAGHLYLGFPMRLVGSRTVVKESQERGVSDSLFMTSRDGIRWQRWSEAFLRPGLDRLNWMHRSNMIAWGVVPTGPAEISLYYTEYYDTPQCQLRRATLRTDGFVSLYAPAAGGEVITRPFTFQGKELVLNYSTSAAGSIRAELQTAEGKPLPGFGINTCELYGDDIEGVASWKGVGSDVSRFAGQRVRLRFVLKDADLYSLRFRP